jgi:hypothetical protein
MLEQVEVLYLNSQHNGPDVTSISVDRAHPFGLLAE